MAKASKNKRTRPRKAAETPPLRSRPNWPILGLSLVGVGLAGYLTGLAWTGEQAAFCEAGADCDIVLNSRWSTLLGMPTSFWGFLTYAALAGISFVRRIDTHWKLASAVSLFGVVYSAYLTTASQIQLDATCPYCVTSAGLFTAIFAVTLFQRPQDVKRPYWKPWLAGSLGGAVVLLAAIHFTFYSGSLATAGGPEDPWIRGLAQHLTKANAKFYGAFWCPHCIEQKGMFGSSAHRLPYVECSPSGRRGPQSSACRAAGIQSYPTWIINGRRHSGVLTPSSLAELSGFSGIETSTAKQGGG